MSAYLKIIFVGLKPKFPNKIPNAKQQKMQSDDLIIIIINVMMNTICSTHGYDDYHDNNHNNNDYHDNNHDNQGCLHLTFPYEVPWEPHIITLYQPLMVKMMIRITIMLMMMITIIIMIMMIRGAFFV